MKPTFDPQEAGQIREYFEIACRTALEALWAYRYSHPNSIYPLPSRIRRSLEKLYLTMTEYLEMCCSQGSKTNCFPYIGPDVSVCR
jgi:hypothetical protein